MIVNNLEDVKLEENPSIKEGNDVIKEFYDAVDSIQPPISPNISEEYNDIKWNNTNISQNNNFHKFPENSEEVIQNYLSVKDEHFLGSNDENFASLKDDNDDHVEKSKPQSPSKLSSTSPKKLSKPPRKLKSAAPTQPHNKSTVNRPTTSKPTSKPLKKAKSLACLRDNTVLDEFQIDKIESWMSMHDDSLSDRDEALHLHHHHHHHRHQHQVQWNATNGTPTTNSKTDDEGNFSLDDHIDINSGTESTYDEIVEIIKEIDSEKRKSQEDLKNIKKSVEFKLKNLMSKSPESSDSAVSEDTRSEESNDKMK